jgi:hypothetical protein
MASFKFKHKLTENQKANGFGNSIDSIGASGFLYVGGLDSIHSNLVATGSSVSFKYFLQTKDLFNNVLDLHTGEFLAAGNQVVLIEPNSYEFLRVFVSDYVSGALFGSVAGRNTEDK